MIYDNPIAVSLSLANPSTIFKSAASWLKKRLDIFGNKMAQVSEGAVTETTDFTINVLNEAGNIVDISALALQSAIDVADTVADTAGDLLRTDDIVEQVRVSSESVNVCAALCDSLAEYYSQGAAPTSASFGEWSKGAIAIVQSRVGELSSSALNLIENIHKGFEDFNDPRLILQTIFGALKLGTSQGDEEPDVMHPCAAVDITSASPSTLLRNSLDVAANVAWSVVKAGATALLGGLGVVGSTLLSLGHALFTPVTSEIPQFVRTTQSNKTNGGTIGNAYAVAPVVSPEVIKSSYNDDNALIDEIEAFLDWASPTRQFTVGSVIVTFKYTLPDGSQTSYSERRPFMRNIFRHVKTDLLNRNQFSIAGYVDAILSMTYVRYNVVYKPLYYTTEDQWVSGGATIDSLLAKLRKLTGGWDWYGNYANVKRAWYGSVPTSCLAAVTSYRQSFTDAEVSSVVDAISKFNFDTSVDSDWTISFGAATFLVQTRSGEDATITWFHVPIDHQPVDSSDAAAISNDGYSEFDSLASALNAAIRTTIDCFGSLLSSHISAPNSASVIQRMLEGANPPYVEPTDTRLQVFNKLTSLSDLATFLIYHGLALLISEVSSGGIYYPYLKSIRIPKTCATVITDAEVAALTSKRLVVKTAAIATVAAGAVIAKAYNKAKKRVWDLDSEGTTLAVNGATSNQWNSLYKRQKAAARKQKLLKAIIASPVAMASSAVTATSGLVKSVFDGITGASSADTGTEAPVSLISLRKRILL